MLHQHVGQQQRERLVADQFARAPHRMAEAERLLLPGEARRARAPAGPAREIRAPCAFCRSRSVISSSNWRSKWSSMTPLLRPVTKMKCSMPACARLVDDMLDQRPVDHRQHFLRHGLGGRQEPGAEAGDGEDGFADGFMRCRWAEGGVRRVRFIAQNDPATVSSAITASPGRLLRNGLGRGRSATTCC